mmetsp:Transcript_12321/g.20448  ORF Transcript_12321/g.20448 Transcript_12321/m.20448 type:complete len:125 (+) Transcript_12321:29-403(+)
MKHSFILRTLDHVRFTLERYCYQHNFFAPQLKLAGATVSMHTHPDSLTSSIFDNFLWFAAPKSKISPSRKRMKHGRLFPKRVDWVQCERCGEPKRPHRICTANIDICAMRDEEWQEYKRNMGDT